MTIENTEARCVRCGCERKFSQRAATKGTCVNMVRRDGHWANCGCHCVFSNTQSPEAQPTEKENRVIDEALLKALKEQYRQVAFPKGGAKTIRTRDKQNAALVARGGYRCCQYLLEILQRTHIERRVRERGQK